MQFGGMVKLVLGTALITTMLSMQSACAQNSQPARGMSSVTVKNKKISIDYGRPEMKGRDMLAMAPDGFVWRMGKDDDTTFSTESDLMFGDITVAKGSYIAETKHVKGDVWSLILNKDGNKTEIPYAYTSGQESVEMFTIEITNNGNKGALTVIWGGHRLSASFEVK